MLLSKLRRLPLFLIRIITSFLLIKKAQYQTAKVRSGLSIFAFTPPFPTGFVARVTQ